MRTRRLVGIALAFSIAGACRHRDSDRSQADETLSAAVSSTRIDRGAVKEVLVTYGTAEFDPSSTHDLPFLRAGTVRRVEVVRGQRVDAHDRLVVLGPVPMRSLAAEQADIDLDFATRQLERLRRLASMKLATNEELEGAQRTVATRRAALRALGLGGAADQVLVAPAHGVVSEVQAKPGMMVHAGQTALRLVADGRMVVRTGFELEELPELAVGLPVEIRPIYGDGEQEAVDTHLSDLHRVADSANQLVEALLEVPKPPAWIVPGERVELRVVLRQSASALRVPRDALLVRQHREGVITIHDGKAHWTPVEVLARGDRWLAVKGEIREGLPVVTAGRSSLLDGMRVRMGRATPPP